MNFKREDRYIVLKRSDLMNLSRIGWNNLDNIAAIHNDYRDEIGKLRLECVVVESDWPEYEIVWKMIEDRIKNDKISKN